MFCQPPAKEYKTYGWIKYEWPHCSYIVPELFTLEVKQDAAEMQGSSAVASATVKCPPNKTCSDEERDLKVYTDVILTGEEDGANDFLVFKFNPGLYSQIFVNSLFSVNFENLLMDFVIFLSNWKIFLIDSKSENFYFARE